MFILVPSTRQNVDGSNSSNSGGRSSSNGNGSSRDATRLEPFVRFFIFSFILLQLMFILGPFNALRVETVMAATAPAPAPRA
jgi:hypothetical protein